MFKIKAPYLFQVHNPVRTPDDKESL